MSAVSPAPMNLFNTASAIAVRSVSDEELIQHGSSRFTRPSIRRAAARADASQFPTPLLASGGAALAIAAGGLTGIVLAYELNYSKAAEEVASLATYRPSVITRVYADDGETVIGEFALEKRIPLKFEEIPPQVAKGHPRGRGCALLRPRRHRRDPHRRRDVEEHHDGQAAKAVRPSPSNLPKTSFSRASKPSNESSTSGRLRSRSSVTTPSSRSWRCTSTTSSWARVRLRLRGRCGNLLRQAGERPDDRRSRAARRHPARAEPVFADRQHPTRQRAAQSRLATNGEQRIRLASGGRRGQVAARSTRRHRLLPVASTLVAIPVSGRRDQAVSRRQVHDARCAGRVERLLDDQCRGAEEGARSRARGLALLRPWARLAFASTTTSARRERLDRDRHPAELDSFKHPDWYAATTSRRTLTSSALITKVDSGAERGHRALRRVHGDRHREGHGLVGSPAEGGVQAGRPR